MAAVTVWHRDANDEVITVCVEVEDQHPDVLDMAMSRAVQGLCELTGIVRQVKAGAGVEDEGSEP